MYEENVILRKAFTAMIEAENDPGNYHDDDDFTNDDLYEDGYDGVYEWLRDAILNFSPDGEPRSLGSAT